MDINYSFVIPVYNRPEEIGELLQSMEQLDFQKTFEVVVVEDGSTLSSKAIVEKYSQTLNIAYFQKPNSGPGNSRNFGMRKARGNYFLILDSDVVLPSHYLKEVDKTLQEDFVDCFGGPDAAHQNFTPIQKAINYAMTSLFTTGGIRGNKNGRGKFQPRSFNMGLSKKAFEASGGFGKIHPGEDPDLVLRLQKMGIRTRLFPDAFVYHKRRINWRKFYQQVYKFGKVRAILNKWHPGSKKITYWFPAFFCLGFLLALLFLVLGMEFFILVYLGYFGIILLDASVQNNSLKIGFYSVWASLVQFIGYGLGFCHSTYYIRMLKKNPEKCFPQLFFKGNI